MGNDQELPDSYQAMRELPKSFAADQAERLRKAEAAVQDAVRKILAKYEGDLDEFVMAMGTYFFVATKGGVFDRLTLDEDSYDQSDSEDYADSDMRMGPEFEPEFGELISELDAYVNITGSPMRIKHGMKVVYDWGDTCNNPIIHEPL